jgi:hypothetical protein
MPTSTPESMIVSRSSLLVVHEDLERGARLGVDEAPGRVELAPRMGIAATAHRM